MTFFEKTYCSLSIAFAFGITIAFVLYPELRQMSNLLPICAIGLLVNIGFMFVILRNIITKTEFDQKEKSIWVIAVLLFWPTAILYLFLYGFRNTKTA